MNTNPNSEQKNVIAYPDYSQILGHQTNSAIIKYFVAFLLAKDTKLNAKTVIMLIKIFAIVLIIKNLLEESATYLDKFRFTNLDYIKYQYQHFMYSEIKHEISLSSDTKKWSINNICISMNSLSPFLDSKSIYVSQPGTYYIQYQSFMIKVITTNNKIIFHAPNVRSITQFMDDLLYKHREIILGNRTNLLKVTLSSASELVQFNGMRSTYSFETDNYKKLFDSLQSIFMVDSIINIRQSPLCINFDGEPGTGKTTFAPYIAGKGLFDRIFTYNLLQATNFDFKTLLTNLEVAINNRSPKDKNPDDEQERILLIFDEVDKYLDSYISNKIDSFRTEARTTTEKKGTISEPVITKSFTKLTLEEEADKRLQLRFDFLDKLYDLCDGQKLKNDKKYVIIFNTNDFNSLFIGTSPKYNALRDRFQQYTFTFSKKQDIIRFMEDIKNKLKNEKNESINITNILNYDEKMYDMIPDNIEISCRNLFKIFTDNCFDMQKSIKYMADEAY